MEEDGDNQRLFSVEDLQTEEFKQYTEDYDVECCLRKIQKDWVVGYHQAISDSWRCDKCILNSVLLDSTKQLFFTGTVVVSCGGSVYHWMDGEIVQEHNRKAYVDFYSETQSELTDTNYYCHNCGRQYKTRGKLVTGTPCKVCSTPVQLEEMGSF